MRRFHFFTVIFLSLIIHSVGLAQKAKIVKDAKGMYGLQDESGKIILKHQYNHIYGVQNSELFIVRKTENKKHKHGLIDGKGKTLLPVLYNSLGYISENRLISQKEKGFDIIDVKGTILKSYNFDNYHYWVKGGEEEDKIIVAFTGENKAGIIDLKKNEPIIDPSYYCQNISNFYCDGGAHYSDGAEFAFGKDGKWGVLNNRGEEIIPFEYEYIHLVISRDGKFSYAGVMKNGKMAVMNSKKELITKFEFDGFLDALNKDKLLVLVKGDSLKFLDPKKMEWSSSFRPRYGSESIEKFRQKKGKVNYEAGKVIIPFEYEDLDRESYKNSEKENISFYFAIKNGKTGAVDMDGKNILPFEFESILPIHLNKKDLFLSKKNDKWAISTFAEIGNSEYKYDDVMHDKYASAGELLFVKKDGKIGGINAEEELKLPFEFDEIKSVKVRRDIAKHFFVRKGNKWGVYDINNKVVIPIKHKVIGLIKDYVPLYIVKKGSKIGAFDINGEEKLSLKYLDIKHYKKDQKDYFLVQAKDNYALYNSKMEPLTDFEIDKVVVKYGYVKEIWKGDEQCIPYPNKVVWKKVKK